MIASEPWLDGHIFNESEMARSSECTERYAQNLIDNADIVREAIFRQVTDLLGSHRPISVLRVWAERFSSDQENRWSV